MYGSNEYPASAARRLGLVVGSQSPVAHEPGEGSLDDRRADQLPLRVRQIGRVRPPAHASKLPDHNNFVHSF